MTTSLKLLIILDALLAAFEGVPGAVEKICLYSQNLVQIEPMRLPDLFTALQPLLVEQRDDENLWLFLIEEKDRFNRHLGARTVENLLHTAFPEGLQALRQSLAEGFARRGFASFFAEKSALLDDLCLA